MRYLTNLWVHMVLKFPKILFAMIYLFKQAFYLYRSLAFTTTVLCVDLQRSKNWLVECCCLSDLSAGEKKLSCMGSGHLLLLPALVNHFPLLLSPLINCGLSCGGISRISPSSCWAFDILPVAGGNPCFPLLCACVPMSTGHMMLTPLGREMHGQLCSTL